MNEMDAVKTKEDIDKIADLLLKHGNQDFSDIWKLGINVAFRISDLLSITYEGIALHKRELTLIEGKTGKRRTVRLNDNAMGIINERRALYPLDVYLFQSHSNRGRSACKPLDRSSVARKFKEIGNMHTVCIALGTHSMRKTRGYMMHSASVPIEQISLVLNHSSPSTTLAYIGITKEDTLNTYDEFNL